MHWFVKNSTDFKKRSQLDCKHKYISRYNLYDFSPVWYCEECGRVFAREHLIEMGWDPESMLRKYRTYRENKMKKILNSILCGMGVVVAAVGGIFLVVCLAIFSVAVRALPFILVAGVVLWLLNHYGVI